MRKLFLINFDALLSEIECMGNNYTIYHINLNRQVRLYIQHEGRYVEHLL